MDFETLKRTLEKAEKTKEKHEFTEEETRKYMKELNASLSKLIHSSWNVSLIAEKYPEWLKDHIVNLKYIISQINDDKVAIYISSTFHSIASKKPEILSNEMNFFKEIKTKIHNDIANENIGKTIELIENFNGS